MKIGMDKMVLVPAEEYSAIKRKERDDTDASNEASDVKVAKFQDAFIRKQNAKKIREDENWERLSSRLRPIFASLDHNEILKKIPSFQVENAKFVLNVLARLPKVTLSGDKLFIDGQPMGESLVTIVDDIVRNDVGGVESLIQSLRGNSRVPKKPSIPSLTMETLDMADDDEEEMKMTSPISQRKIPSLPYTPSLLSKLTSLTPPKTKIPSPVKSPVIKDNPSPRMGNVGKVARTPVKKTASIVLRSPINLRSKNDGGDDKKSKSENTSYWLSYD